MRDGVEYEFTTVFDLDTSHQAEASKDRTQMFSDKIFQITEKTGVQFKQWLLFDSERAKKNSRDQALENANGVN